MNSRVNYLVKQCLVQMEESGEFDIENLVHKYCINFLGLRFESLKLEQA